MTGFVPPPYPYDRLAPVIAAAAAHDGGAVDLSIGTPCDPPPAQVIDALRSAAGVRTYPASAGSAEYREAAAGWVERRFGVHLDPAHVAACVGTKELVAGVPTLLRLRRPEKSVVLHPAVAYPTYAMGAVLAGCRPVEVPVDADWRLRLDAIDPKDAADAVCLWVNSPGNPTGALDDLAAAAAWGRSHGVPVFSDECYVEFTWGHSATQRQAASILESGLDGVVAVHSLSKRSNLAGGRVGFYAGDPELVHYLSEVRKHQGLMVAGPFQAAGAVAWTDDLHVEQQRDRYRKRLTRLAELLAPYVGSVPLPAGAFYLWVPAPDGDPWALAHRLALEIGVVVSPGEFYGAAGSGHVRVAAVQPDDRIEQLFERRAARESDTGAAPSDRMPTDSETEAADG